MAGSLNKVQLIGNITKDIERRTTGSGKTVVNVSLATNEYFKKEKRTEYHRLIFWEKLADIVSQYCKKGSSIYVEGRLQTSEWQDKDGNKRYTTEIVVNQMQMLDSKSVSQFQETSGEVAKESQFLDKQQMDHQVPPGNDMVEDDVPF